MTDEQKMTGGCGGHCKCAEAKKEVEADTCAVPSEGVNIDIEGKCPCGKPASQCCHNDKAGVAK